MPILFIAHFISMTTNITDNFAIRNIHHLSNSGILSLPFCHVTFIALNYHFHQLNVFGYHLFNLVVHLVSAILVWWLTF